MAKQTTTTRKQAGSQRPKKQKAESASQNGQDVSSFEKELAEYLQDRIKPGLNRGAIPMLARSIAKDIARRQSSEDENGDDVDGDSTEAEAEEDQVQAEADDTDVEDTEDDYTEAEADDDEAEADYDEEAEADDDTEAEADEDYDEADDDAEAEADDDTEAEADDDTEAEADDDYEDEDEDEPAAEANGNGSSDFEAAMRELQGELGDDWILRFSVQGDESWLTAEKDDGSQRVQAATASVLSEVVELLNEDG